MIVEVLMVVMVFVVNMKELDMVAWWLFKIGLRLAKRHIVSVKTKPIGCYNMTYFVT